MAGRVGDDQAQARLPPFDEPLEIFRGGVERGERLFDLREQLFAEVVDVNSFAHPVEKTTAQLGFQRLQPMADG